MESSAFLLLFAIGGELLLHELLHITISELQQFLISLGIFVLTILVVRTPLKKPVMMLLTPFRYGCFLVNRGVNAIINGVMSPFRAK